MTDRIVRRRFLTRMSLGLGVTALGCSLAWWASAPAAPPNRKWRPAGDGATKRAPILCPKQWGEG